MNNLVSLDAKKRFISWLLRNRTFKKSEFSWLLKFLLSDRVALEHFHFVYNLRGIQHEHCIIASTSCSKGDPFYYRRGSVVSYDVEKAFCAIRHRPSEDVYVVVHFKDSHEVPEFRNVLLDQAPENSDNIVSLLAEIFLDRVLYEGNMTRLRNRIDESLEQGDYERFIDLSEELSSLQKERELYTRS